MKSNVGSLDRIVRVVLGAGILSLAFIGPQTPFGYIGIVPLLTGIFGFCPAYLPFGLSTCRVADKA